MERGTGFMRDDAGEVGVGEPADVCRCETGESIMVAMEARLRYYDSFFSLGVGLYGRREKKKL